MFTFLIIMVSINSPLLICIFLSLTIFPQHNCFEFKKFFRKLGRDSSSSSSEEDSGSHERNTLDFREHGNFDTFGRDVVRLGSEGINTFANYPQDLKPTQGMDSNKTFSDTMDKFKSRIKLIYPGTKWCGKGHTSNSYDDLGRFSSTDACCRDHDLCPDNIKKGLSKHGLVNTGLFTRSHCDCDAQFYRCLKEARNIVAKSIGYTYFTVLGPQCFREDYPIVRCQRKKKGKCIRYRTDRRGPVEYQWFDSPPF